MTRELIDLGKRFPALGEQLRHGLGDPIEEVLPGASETELAELEERLRLKLPPSYRAFLQCTRGLWLLGGVVQLSRAHPFFHSPPPVADPAAAPRSVVHAPSDGMLCFAEFFMEADGDQVLFDMSRRGPDGESPVMYYAHEGSPPQVRELAPNFLTWLEQFLEYPEFIS